MTWSRSRKEYVRRRRRKNVRRGAVYRVEEGKGEYEERRNRKGKNNV